jgi:hypothetical protein
MRSSISSSKTAIVTAFALLFALPLAAHEWAVRTYYLNGGFVQLITIGERPAGEFERSTTAVLGSSRAKESIRPSAIEDARREWAPAVNHAAHSATSVDQVDWLVKSVAVGNSAPSRLIVTVEPLHFSSAYVMYDRVGRRRVDPAAVPPPRSQLRAVAQRIQDRSQALQADVGNAVGDVVYEIVESASPQQKRDVTHWLAFLMSGVGATARQPARVAANFTDAYMFHVIGKGARFYSTVVFEERGFEGHVLHLATPDATRLEAFASHMGQYPNGVLASYQPSYIEKFRNDLRRLQPGREIVLVRLPIYRDLYRIEEEKVPDFNAAMERLAGELGVRYVNFNTPQYAWLTDSEDAFTDASHMEFDHTEAFTKAMMQALGGS